MPLCLFQKLGLFDPDIFFKQTSHQNICNEKQTFKLFNCNSLKDLLFLTFFLIRVKNKPLTATNRIGHRQQYVWVLL